MCELCKSLKELCKLFFKEEVYFYNIGIKTIS
jgi:hypothetical protein